MNEYNPLLLERHAKRLFRNARVSLITIPLLVAILGMAAGAGYAYLSKLYIIKDLLVYAIVGGVIGMLVGILFGLSASARKHEEAQMALGILRIEQNTRPTSLDASDFIPLDTSEPVFSGVSSGSVPMQTETQTE
jgi:L-cystine uptake protein TcyP (sodium:dicarboxylate symporter family)